MHLERKLGSLLYDKIDWVAGTSTGAIVALSLAQRILNNFYKIFFRAFIRGNTKSLFSFEKMRFCRFPTL